jgi:hypothetical protein
VTAPKATEALLRDHLAAWLKAPRRRARTILVRAQPTWSGPRTLDIDGRSVRVVEGVSGLAALDAMRSAPDGEYVAVLTELDESALGTAVVLDAEHRKPTELNAWSSVSALFGARDAVIPRPVLELGNWVPVLLGTLRRDRGYPPAPGGVLSPEHVARSILVALLGLERLDHLDIADALTPLDDLGVRARLAEMDAESREGLIRGVGTHIDHHLAMALRAATSSGRVSVVAIGLVVAELWASGGVPLDAEAAAARVRAEQYIGVAPSASAASRFGAAAQLIARRWLAAGDRHAHDTFQQAEAICADLGWTEGAEASSLLPAGLAVRVQRFAHAVQTAVIASGPAEAQDVEVALAEIESHGASALFEQSLPTAQMATRLVRWLQTNGKPAPDLAGAVNAYVADGAWAERALGDLWDGDTDRALGDAYQSLAHAVQAIRRRDDAAAATSLTGAALIGADVTPIERVLADLVVPLAHESRVLLIVLDGMSVPTAIELAAELVEFGWTELVRAHELRRGAALAVLPTITEYSRMSLLSGELVTGNLQTEKSRFSTAVQGTLFHKNDLRSDAGHALSPAVVDVIADPSQKIVGAVLNTIDDALDTAEVDSLRWSVRSVANLEALLASARTAGRVVILTSDHGHIVERGSELRRAADASARWRVPSTGAVHADEVLVSGPRVLAPGGRAVLAVSDGVRYAAKKAGYHGGGSLAEVTIPILVLKPRGAEDPSGWVEAPPQEPAWWNEPIRVTAVEAPTSQSESAPKPRTSKKPDPAVPTLFDPEPVPMAAPPASAHGLADQLLASPTYQARRGSVGRHPVDDRVARVVVVTLDAGGGRAHRDTLATAAGIAVGTFAGLLATFRRVLNVDSYPVIELDADGVTVVLDRDLLREQFELGSP